MKSVLIIAAFFALISAQIQNGGFEDNSCESNLWCDYGVGNFCPYWDCYFGTIDIHESNPSQLSCYEGSYCVDVSGNYEGGITQAFTTVAGHSYTISWYQSGNPNCGSIVKGMDVNVNFAEGATPAPTQHYEFDVSDTYYGHMGYVQETYDFTAANYLASVYFASTEASSCGMVIDAISLTDNTPLTPDGLCASVNPNQWAYGQGYYCFGNGFVQCWGSDPVYSAYQDCPAGTSCQCALEVECSGGGIMSPCR